MLDSLFPDTTIQIIIFPFMVMFVFLAISSFRQELFGMVIGLQSHTWKTTPAQLTRREIVFEKGDETADYYHICIDYTYQVGKKTYTSHRIAFGLSEYQQQETKAKAILEQYVPSEPTLTVYVNPLNPQEAVIHRGRDLNSFLGEIAWALFYVLCAGLLYLIYQRV